MASEVGTVAVSTQRVPAADTATDWLWRRAHDVIEAYLATRGKADFARSVKSMTDQTVHEYGGRFLHELVQNGYDAHPADRTDGQVTLRLDCTEGPHGVLYVANAGRGFSESNVRAISNLGLSDKTIGEGIGNKGVGFKSVLQVCADPEVYSRTADDDLSPGSASASLVRATSSTWSVGTPSWPTTCWPTCRCTTSPSRSLTFRRPSNSSGPRGT